MYNFYVLSVFLHWTLLIGFHHVQHLFLSLHSHLIRVNIISKSDFAYYFVKENWTGEREEVIGKSCVTSIEIGCTFTTDQDTRQQQFFLSFETFPSSKEKFRRPSSFLFAGLQTMRKKTHLVTCRCTCSV